MEFKFAWRYFKAKKSTNAINIISWVTAGVIAFATMCQVLVLSVFNGFEDLVKSLYSNFYADVKVVAASGKTIELSSQQLQQIGALQNVNGLSLNVEEKALLQSGDLQTVVLLKGVDKNYNRVSGVSEHMYHGEFDIGSVNRPKLVLGSGIEGAIGIIADRNPFPVTLFLPKRTQSQSGSAIAALSEGNAVTSGSFAIQQDFDNKYVITNLAFVKQQMNYGPNDYTSLEISLVQPNRAKKFTKELQTLLGDRFKVLTKFEQNTSLYNSMRLEKWFIYAVLTLILIISAFNIIGALTMLVLEKHKDISILQALGAGKLLIRNIFLSEGILLAGLGGVAGIVMALIISVIQLKFHVIKLVGSSFLIDYFPVKLVFTDFLLVVATTFLIAFLASWFPARKAARQFIDLK